jgi:hypothetical protein
MHLGKQQTWKRCEMKPPSAALAHGIADSCPSRQSEIDASGTWTPISLACRSACSDILGSIERRAGAFNATRQLLAHCGCRQASSIA